MHNFGCEARRCGGSLQMTLDRLEWGPFLFVASAGTGSRARTTKAEGKTQTAPTLRSSLRLRSLRSEMISMQYRQFASAFTLSSRTKTNNRYLVTAVALGEATGECADRRSAH